MGNDTLYRCTLNRSWQGRSSYKVFPYSSYPNISLWTKWTIFAIPGSFVIWMLFFPVYAFVAPLLGFSQEYQGILPHIFGSLPFWATIVVVPVMCLVRDFAWK
jgi:hypothetical protein